MAEFVNFVVNALTDYAVLLNYDDSDRLTLSGVAYELIDPALGVSVSNGAQVDLTVELDVEFEGDIFDGYNSAVVESYIHRENGEAHYNNTNFDYALTQDEETEPDSTYRISVDSDTNTVDVSGQMMFAPSGSGINKQAVLYLAERVGLPSTFCHSALSPLNPTTKTQKKFLSLFIECAVWFLYSLVMVDRCDPCV